MLMPSIFSESLLDSFIDEFANPRGKSARIMTPGSGVMRTDIKENDKEFELEIELPGFKTEDIKVSLKDGYLTVNARSESESSDKDEKGNYLRRERYYGSCSRSFYVGENLDENDISAKFNAGILRIVVPKKQEVPEVEEQKYIRIEG